jgi:hypothetical protein
MQHRLAVASACVLALLAGCVDSGDEDTSTGMTEPVVMDATGCREVMTVVLRPPEMFQALLPEGYVTADASVLLGLPAPVGLAFATLHTYACDDMVYAAGPFAAGDVTVGVQDPAKTDAPASFHFYVFETYAPAGPYHDLLVAAGWNVLRVDEATVTASASGPLVTGDGGVTNETGPGYTMSVTGAAPTTLTGPARFYHETTAGTSWIEYDLVAEAYAGVADLQAQGGQLPSKLDALLDLFDSPIEVGLVIPAVDWSARLVPAGADDEAAPMHEH